jgi:hypothetical protein
MPRQQQDVQSEARATDPGSSVYVSSSTAAMSIGGMLLFTVGVMFAAVLIVLNIRLAQMMRH